MNSQLERRVEKGSQQKILFLFHFAFSLVLLIVRQTDALGMEANHQRMLRMATYFSEHAVLPTKYFSFTREFSLVSRHEGTFTEHWDAEVHADPARDSVLYLHPFTTNKNEYEHFKVVLLKKTGMAVHVPVQFKYIEMRDGKGRVQVIAIPYCLIPKSSQVDRIQVAMHVAVSDEMDSLEPFLSIDLPKGVAVDQATLIVKSVSDTGEIVGQEMTGFVAQKSEIQQGKIVQRFTLSKPWSGAQNLDKFSRPSIYLSLNSWSDIAARHAKFYQQQLALNTKNAFRQAGVDGEQFERLKGEDIKTVAFHWYKWLGEHFSYFDVGLDFDSATRDQSQPISTLLRKRHGDCKDFALIYVKLLAMSGIDAEPVNTLMNPLGPNPLQHTIPRNHAFNHVIVYIPALDMYVDPTSSVHGFNTFSEFSNQSALFANTHGLHLFSGHLVEIHPGMLQRQISVHTDIEKKNNVWVGTTTWSGKGDGYITLGLIQRGREKRLNSGKNYDVPFNRSNISYIPDSWEFKGNDLTGEATIRFTFQLKEPLVDANNQLQHIPVSPMSVLLFKYDTPNLIAWQELSCFGVEASEEIVRVHGAPDSYHLDDLKDVKLSGVDSEFSQSSTSQEDVFTLKRQFSTRLKKPRCSASEIEIQRNFYAGIQKITLMPH